MRIASAVLALLFVAAGGFLSPASAHAGLVSSSPGDGGSVLLSGGSAQVSFEFNEPVLNDGAFVVVLDTSGVEATEGDLTVDGARVSRSFSGDAGTYTATYRVVSQDGHPISGSITFTAIAEEAESADAPPPTEDQAAPSALTRDTDDSVPIWPFLIGVPIVIVLGYALVRRVRANRR